MPGCAIRHTRPRVGGREKLYARLFKDGLALTQTDFGNPLGDGGTAYALCIYGPNAGLAGEVRVDRAGDSCGKPDCWRALGGDTMAIVQLTSSDGVCLTGNVTRKTPLIPSVFRGLTQ